MTRKQKGDNDQIVKDLKIYIIIAQNCIKQKNPLTLILRNLC